MDWRLGIWRERFERWRAQMPEWAWARFSNHTWLEAVHPKVRAAVREWKPGRDGLALFGPTGTGKTSAIVARLYEFSDLVTDGLRAGRRLRAPRLCWTRDIDLMNARRRHKLGQGEAPEIDAALDAEILVLDDIGRADADLMFEVADGRYTTKKPTVITSGLTTQQVFNRFGDATFRRLTEESPIVLDLNG